ncbi:MAG: hypothetical protein ABIP36_04570 [Acidimicrobiales bacterium]
MLGREPADDAATTTAAADATTTTTARAPTFTADVGSPFCDLLDDVDLATVLGGVEGEPAAVASAFQQLVDLLVQAAELAPDEIRADVALVADGMVSLDAALAAVDYDFDALAASPSSGEVIEAVNDPAFADAGVRVGAYRTQACGL